MKKKVVISSACLPTRSPILSLVVISLLMDRFHSPSWGWGVFGTLSAILVVGWVYSRFVELHDKVPGFGDKP